MMTDSKPTNLGRGLSALLGEPESAASSEETERAPKSLPVEFLHPGKYQPRRHMDEDRIRELAQSIGEQGVLQPLLVRRHPDEPNDFEIIAGERRWRAAQLARLHEVPVIIKDLSDPEALEIALVENLQRQDLSPLEEAEGYQRLMDEFGHTQEVLAAGVGKSRSHVANMMRLLNLPGPVKAMLDSGELSAGHARALLNAPDPSEVARRVVNDNLNVRQTERLVRKVVKQGGLKKPAAAIDPDTKNLERDLTEQLGLDVAIRPKQGSGGTVVIKYADLEQLDAIVDRLSGKASPAASHDDKSSTPSSPPAKKSSAAKSPKPKSKSAGDQSPSTTKKTSTSSAASGSSRSTSTTAPSKSKQKAKEPEPDPDPGTTTKSINSNSTETQPSTRKSQKKPEPGKSKIQSSPPPKHVLETPAAKTQHKNNKTKSKKSKPEKISRKSSPETPPDKPITKEKNSKKNTQDKNSKASKETTRPSSKKTPPKEPKTTHKLSNEQSPKPKPKIKPKAPLEPTKDDKLPDTVEASSGDIDDIFAVVEKVYGASAQGMPLPEPEDAKPANTNKPAATSRNPTVSRPRDKQPRTISKRPQQAPTKPTPPQRPPSVPKADGGKKNPKAPQIEQNNQTNGNTPRANIPRKNSASDTQATATVPNASPIPVPPNRATPAQQKERAKHKERMAKGLPPKLTVNLKPADNQQ